MDAWRIREFTLLDDLKQSPRIAIIGCGRWGANHVRTFHDLGHLALACDTDTDRLAFLRAHYPDLELCRDPDTVLTRADIDAVVLATPAPTHSALTLAALAARKDVLVEKPLATSLLEGEKVVAEAIRLERVLMVGFVLQHHPAVRALLNVVAMGQLGQIRSIDTQRVGCIPGMGDDDLLVSLVPHDVAIALRLLGDYPTSVECRSADLESSVALSLQFANDARVEIWAETFGTPRARQVVVTGDKGRAIFDDTLQPNRMLTTSSDHDTPRYSELWQPVAFTWAEPLRQQCEAFIDCIAFGRPNDVDGRLGLDVLRTTEAARKFQREEGQMSA